MSSAYNYSLENDFIVAHLIHVLQFSLEVQNNENITPNLINIGVEGDTVTLTFDAPLSGGEMAELDTLVETHSPGSDQFDYIAVLSDEKATTINGGTFTSGAWQTRELNTVHGENVDYWVTLSGNEFTLSDGYYFLTVNARSSDVGNNQLRLFDVTNNAPVFYGENSDNKIAFLKNHLTVGEIGPVFRIEHRCDTTQADTGFGIANGFGGPETYTQVKVQQL